MIYGILAGNKVHFSEIARSLNETIRLKKTSWRLSRNLFAFEEKGTVMENYISMVKKQIVEENAVIVIDNSDITKLCSPKMEAISDVRDGSTGELKKGYCTIEAAVLLKGEKMHPGKLCECLTESLILAAVYGFGKDPMLLLTNLKMTEKKKLCIIAAKIHLMRWKIEEYFKFKKQQFELEDLRSSVFLPEHALA